MSDDFGLKKAANKSLPVSLTLEHVSPVTRLLEKRKQMLQVQESLDAQKDEYGRKEELFKRREENLRKKDLELQESLILFNRFLKENEQKRRRADHRANDEVKKRLKWEKQIHAHKASVAALRDKCERLKASVLKNEKYHRYLERVQDAYAAHFDELASIITRYHTLKSTNSEMIKLQEALIERNERLRVDFSEYKKKQYNATLALNNDIASEARELEECVKRTSEVEESMIQQEREESEEQRIATQIILATDNLYTRCRRVLHSIRRHGSSLSAAAGAEGRLSEKQKAGMDPSSIIKEETCFKLGEIEIYLTDFRDIIQSIAADNASQEKIRPNKARTYDRGERERERGAGYGGGSVHHAGSSGEALYSHASSSLDHGHGYSHSSSSQIHRSGS